MRALVFVALLVCVSAQCSDMVTVLTEDQGTEVAPPDFLTNDCRWTISSAANDKFVEITLIDFFIDTEPPFCEDSPGFPLVNQGTNELFACAQLGSYCEDEVVAETCPQSCYRCDSCNYNYMTITGTNGIQYFHGCQNIATPLIVDALSPNVFISTNRSFLTRSDQVPILSTDRLKFSWRILPLINHTHLDSLCSGTKYLTADNGTFTDGSAPSASYKPNSNCVWVITAPEGMFVELTFNAFNLQRATRYDILTTNERCESDKVSVVDGAFGTSNAYLMGEFCGQELPPMALSSGRNLSVVFKSDGSIERSGFGVSYRFVENGSVPPVHCTDNATYDQIEGEANVVSGLTEFFCSWHIIPPVDKFVQITFNSHSLTPHQPSCESDVIVVMQGQKLLQRSCDQYIPPPVTGTVSGAAGAVTVSFAANVQTLEYFDFMWKFVDIGGADPVPCTMDSVINATINETGLISDGTRYGIGSLINQRCKWTINAPAGYLIHFDYVYFSLEDAISCSYDYVSVFGGDNGTTLLQKVCGQKLPPHVQSTSNQLVVQFFSDSDVNYDGFLASYEVVSAALFVPPCRGVVTINATAGESGNISDNSGGYASQRQCAWSINAPAGKYVKVEVLDLRLFPREVGLDICIGEFLRAFDGNSATSYMLFQKCGTEKVVPQISTGASMYVQYYSSEQIRDGGFVMRWSVVDAPGSVSDRACFGFQNLPANEGEFSGTIDNYVRGENYRPNSNCAYLITAPKNRYVQIVWQFFSLQEKNWLTRACDDYVSVMDGNSSSSGYELQRSCGARVPLAVTSITNQMLLRFVSDGAIQSLGFIATWTIVDTPGALTCSGVKTVAESPKSGFITDGARGLGYVNRARCTWKLKAPPGLVVAIRFYELQLEAPHGAVCQDYLQFIDGTQVRPRLCGNMSQALLDYNAFTSESNQLDVVFFSDDDNSGAGFNFSYVFVPPIPKGEDNSSQVEMAVAIVLLTFCGIVLLCCGFVFYKKRQAAKAISHINLDRGQDLNRKRTVSGAVTTTVPPPTTSDDIESTGPTAI